MGIRRGMDARSLSASGLRRPPAQTVGFGKSQLRHAIPAPKLSDKEPVTLEADEAGYDRDYGIVVAIGNVEVVQGPYVLRADKLTYFQQRNLVTASGNVSMLQPTGDVYFADHVELTDDMKRKALWDNPVRLYGLEKESAALGSPVAGR